MIQISSASAISWTREAMLTGLAEVVELLVPPDGDGRAVMDADLERDRTPGLVLIEPVDAVPHLERSGDRADGVATDRHRRIAGGLYDRAAVADRGRAQVIEVLLDG